MKKKASIILLLILVQTAVFAQNRQNTTLPRLEPDAKALEYYNLGSLNDGFTWMQLAVIRLWAFGGEPSPSGLGRNTSGDTSAANLEKIRAAAETLNASSDLPLAGRERAEYILTFLHRNFLRSYSLYQTRVDTLLTNGRYNCVSSAVLYTILCMSAGINTSAVVTKDHAFVIVHLDGNDIDVETTNRYGFDPGNRREFHDEQGRLTGFSYVPPQNYRDRQTINRIELVSLIFNNRISDHERASRFAEAVPIAIDRAALLAGDPRGKTIDANTTQTLFEDPMKALLDRLINYGSSLLRANREEDVLRWTEAASVLYPQPDRWQEVAMASVNNRTARFIRENKLTDARSFLENNKNFLTESNYAHLDTVLLEAEILRDANQIKNSSEGDAVTRAIVQEREKSRLSERRAAELITYAVQKTSQVLCAAPARDWRAAITYLENAISHYGANRELEQALNTYRTNLATDYHNRFAAAWNRRNHEEAQRILEEGLAQFPTNRQLLADREIVNKHNSR